MKADAIKSATGHSCTTVVAALKYFRQLVGSILDLEDVTIGGEGVIVELDEAKFGKRKFHVGHPVDGAWVLGGVERTADRKVFLVEVPNRKEETLLSIISTHVKEGSIIFTDCFKSYKNLREQHLHQTVNHCKNFKDPISGCHTNTIEGTWNGIKMNISPRSRTKGQIDEFLAEFIWRRKHKTDLWMGFIEALKEVLYDN